MKNIDKGYENSEIDLFEFVVENRLKDIIKEIPLGQRENEQQEAKHRDITWKQLTHLKQSVAYFLQTQSHRAINDRNYDIKDFQEIDPKSQYNPHEAKYFKEESEKNYSLIKRLKDIINVLRNVMPESKTSDEIRAIYDGYYDILRHRVPPNSKEDKREIKEATTSRAKSNSNLVK